MVGHSMTLLDTLRKAVTDGDVDALREGVRVLARAVMEAEVSELTGVSSGERNPEQRLTLATGAASGARCARVGTIGLAVPRVRDGPCPPGPPGPRRRTERALLTVVSGGARVGGLDAPGRRPRAGDGHRRHRPQRGVPHLRRARRRAGRFRSRPLGDTAFACLWLGATRLKVREAGRVVATACLVAGGRAAHVGRDGPACPLRPPGRPSPPGPAAPARPGGPTGRSGAGRASSASSPDGPASSASSGRSSPGRTTSGETGGAASGRRR